MSIKASEILAMMKRLGFRVTGHHYNTIGFGRGGSWTNFVRGTVKVRGTKDKRHHKFARRMQNSLFPPHRDYWDQRVRQNHSEWQRQYASDGRRPYGFLRASFNYEPTCVPGRIYMRLAIDNGKVWDKPQNCPIILYVGSGERVNELTAWPLPELERRLRKACGKLATKAGHDVSCHFEYDTFMLANNG